MIKFVALLALVGFASSLEVLPDFPVIAFPEYCGDSSQVKDIRFTECRFQPCLVSPGREYTFELDFAPSGTFQSMDFSVSMIDSGSKMTLPLASSVSQNMFMQTVPHTLRYSLTLPLSFAPIDFTLKVELTGNNRMGSKNDVCVLINFEKLIIR